MKLKTPKLVYAATARCSCGAGIAHYADAKPYGDTAYWDCSAILLGEAIPEGQPGSVKHTAKLPFAFYEIKEDFQPSAAGATTRPRVGAHSMNRGPGSPDDSRTKSRKPVKTPGQCPLCAGEVDLLARSLSPLASRSWRCPCGANGIARVDGELAVLAAPEIPKPIKRYGMDGKERER